MLAAYLSKALHDTEADQAAWSEIGRERHEKTENCADADSAAEKNLATVFVGKRGFTHLNTN